MLSCLSSAPACICECVKLTALCAQATAEPLRMVGSSVPSPGGSAEHRKQRENASKARSHHDLGQVYARAESKVQGFSVE